MRNFCLLLLCLLVSATKVLSLSGHIFPNEFLDIVQSGITTVLKMLLPFLTSSKIFLKHSDFLNWNSSIKLLIAFDRGIKT